jgi:hypothetical protein
MYPHVIRLRGPWECVPVDAPGSEPARVTPPCDVREALGAEFRGRVLLRRSFHAPVALVANEALWLVVESVGAPARVTLDGALLGEIAPGRDVVWEWDITARQQTRMLLVIEMTVDAESGTGPTLGAVRLEVRDARNLH